jgi:hypothetical protein
LVTFSSVISDRPFVAMYSPRLSCEAAKPRSFAAILFQSTHPSPLGSVHNFRISYLKPRDNLSRRNQPTFEASWLRSSEATPT